MVLRAFPLPVLSIPSIQFALAKWGDSQWDWWAGGSCCGPSPSSLGGPTLAPRHYFRGRWNIFPKLSGSFSFSKGLLVSPKVQTTLSFGGWVGGEGLLVLGMKLGGLELAKHTLCPRPCCVCYFFCLQCPASFSVCHAFTRRDGEVSLGSGDYSIN